jgi:glycosyltransferase involved in cell wall biosynthesis
MPTADQARRRPRVLVLSLDMLGPRMAGIAIRALETARALAPHADVTLAAARQADEPAQLDVPVVGYHRHDGRTLAPHLQGVDAVIGQPQWPGVMRALERSGARLIFDLSGPEVIETIESHRTAPVRRQRIANAFVTDRLVDALRIGHHFVASSDRQLDLWLGTMIGARLLRPEMYDSDPSFANRMALVPSGLPDEPPRATGSGGARTRFAGIDRQDEVVLWTSAVWPWLDAETPIRAMALLAERRPAARLVFMARQDRAVGQNAAERAQALAQELGVLDRNVFFNDGWVPYDERADWLLDAACAVSCHLPSLETRFSWRTRYLDCFWAGLPVVCTRGEVLADRIAREDLGAAVPEGDPEALAAALEQVLARGRADYAPRLANVADELRWSRATRPLVRFVCDTPLPDRLGAGVRRRPAHALRQFAYNAVRAPLNAAGKRDWPRLGAHTLPEPTS